MCCSLIRKYMRTCTIGSATRFWILHAISGTSCSISAWMTGGRACTITLRRRIGTSTLLLILLVACAALSVCLSLCLLMCSLLVFTLKCTKFQIVYCIHVHIYPVLATYLLSLSDPSHVHMYPVLATYLLSLSDPSRTAFSYLLTLHVHAC